MRVILSLFCLLLFTGASAQTRDLIALAKGDFLGMNALYDEKGNLFGYLSMYDYGKVSDKAKKFEYVVMDKNLNAFASNTFEADLTAGDYTGYINFDGKIVLKPSRMDYNFVKEKDVFTPSSMLIDLKTNTVKKKPFYDFDHGAFKEVLLRDTWDKDLKDYKTEKMENGFNYVSSVVDIKEGGFIVHDYYDYETYERHNRVMRYDDNKKVLWTYKYNKNGSDKESQRLRFLDKDDNHIYCLLLKINELGFKHYLVVLNMKTGEEVHNNEIPDPNMLLATINSFPTKGIGRINNDRMFDDKIVMIGRKRKGENYTGFSRLLIDKKTFAADLRYITYNNDFRRFVPGINASGFVGDDYILDPRDIFFLKDGSIGLLFEKYKSGKHSDVVYVYTDKNFNVTGAKIFEKERSKGTNADYLFSQNLNDDKDLVFFYRDHQKDDETNDRNWNLYINTMIDGKFHQEVIPISSKENYIIYPYVAKEGYILLQEFNKKSKYNQLRLERLNY